MDRRHAALVVAATLVAGCGVARSSDEEQKQALERRVAELEQKLAQAQGEKPAVRPFSEPSAETVGLGSEDPAEGGAAAEPAPAVRRAPATRATTRSWPAPRAAAR